MKKIRTLTALSEQLDSEFSWRLKELADYKFLLKEVNSSRHLSLIRAGVPLIYAHWEGFVKASAQYYLAFVLAQKAKVRELSPCFVAMSKRSLLYKYREENRSRVHNRLVEELMRSDHLEKVASFSASINTRSNLNSVVFTDISLSIGVPLSNYETRFKFIDESLLKRRNEIAHGAYLDIDSSTFIDIIDGVILLLRLFKTDIENAAALKKYMNGV